MDIRYFAFFYRFFDILKQRTRRGIWNTESAEGFPNAKDLHAAIESGLKGMGVKIEPGSVCITGWQEFQNENDYRNFSN